MVVVYKWGGIAFDDKALIKTLILPSDAKDDVPITFHDNGVDYQVPVDHVFIVGKIMYGIQTVAKFGRVGESDAADGAITKEVIMGLGAAVNYVFVYQDAIGIYTAGKYVTGESNSTGGSENLLADTTLYGVEIDA